MKKKYSKDTGKLFRKNKEKDTDKKCFFNSMIKDNRSKESNLQTENSREKKLEERNC